jgi:hypothetical protein
MVKFETPIWSAREKGIEHKSVDEHGQERRSGTHSLDFTRREELDHRFPRSGDLSSLQINHDLVSVPISARSGGSHRLARKERSWPANKVPANPS